jgi:hypothetical protein
MVWSENFSHKKSEVKNGEIEINLLLSVKAARN